MLLNNNKMNNSNFVISISNGGYKTLVVIVAPEETKSFSSTI